MKNFQLGRMFLLFIPALVRLSQPSTAEENAHKSVRAAYERAIQAAELKYIDGILSVRAKNFQAFGVNGRAVDSKRERVSLERLLGPALSIREKSDIVSFKEKDPTHVVCQVHDVIRVVMPAPQPRPPAELVIDTQCTDEWQKIGNTWKQISNRIQRQTYDNHNVAPGQAQGSK